MNMIDSLKEQFEQLQASDAESGLTALRQDAFNAFTRLGIPTTRNEDWKYTRISGLFNKEYRLAGHEVPAAAQLEAVRLPGHEQANELFFINGLYEPSLSVIRSAELKVLSLEEAAAQHSEVFSRHFNHSSQYIKDGINALNTALAHDGVFIMIPRGQTLAHPVYLYNICDAAAEPVFAQPRSFLYAAAGSELQMVETYATIGNADTFTNQVMEVVAEDDARITYYKIQNDHAHASQVSTTHFRQTGKSLVNAVTITLDGAVVRNNLNVVLEAEHAEAHLYGLYLAGGQTHISNYTIVDNVVPNCLSNELYKGVLNGAATGVFNGKIFVRKDAQKTNAFQSNKNILLSESASVNTKPQLEIFADDVKCSHGCTVGQLDEDGLFYLQSRGIPEQKAVSLLLQGFVTDILEKISLAPIRNHVQHLIAERLESEKA